MAPGDLHQVSPQSSIGFNRLSRILQAMATYNPRDYWQQRLKSSFNLRGVGHMRFSEEYNRWLYARKQDCLETLLHADEVRGKRVLDVGCGTGFFVRWFSERGAAVHGADITDVSVANLRQQFPQHQFTVADIASSSFSIAGDFHIVNTWDVLYHIVDDEKHQTALRNLARAVAPGGRLILTDQLAGAGNVQPATHVRFRCLATYQKHLPELGLELQHLRPLYFKLNDDRTGRPQSDALAPEYYDSDSTSGLVARDNLSIGVWTRT